MGPPPRTRSCHPSLPGRLPLCRLIASFTKPTLNIGITLFYLVTNFSCELVKIPLLMYRHKPCSANPRSRDAENKRKSLLVTNGRHPCLLAVSGRRESGRFHERYSFLLMLTFQPLTLPALFTSCRRRGHCRSWASYARGSIPWPIVKD